MGRLLSDLIRTECDNSSPCNEYNQFNFFSTFPDNIICCQCKTTLIRTNNSRNPFLSSIYTLYKKHIFCWGKDCKDIWRRQNENIIGF